jgi:hypothetical protein
LRINASGENLCQKFCFQAKGPFMTQPTEYSKNQFGEVEELNILGGTNQIDINFIVDKANGNGFGTRSLKGSPLVSSVYMNTSATPASGNPNPLAGFCLVNFAKPFSGYVGGGSSGVVSPLSGSNINISSGLTIGQAYVIVSIGTSTAANWQALGLPANIVPAVGAAFIATSSSAGTGTGVVQVPSVSGLSSQLEVVGDINQTCNPATGGGYAIVQFIGPTISTGAYVAPFLPTAPANNTVVGMRFVMNLIPGGPVA